MGVGVPPLPELVDTRAAAKVITAETRKAMKQILVEIQSGELAREWIAENGAGGESFMRMRTEQAASQLKRPVGICAR